MRLCLFSRRLSVATDDMFWPAGLGMLLHIVIIALSSAFIQECSIEPYPLMTLASSSFSLLIAVGLMYSTLQGTVANPEPRRFVSQWVYASLCAMLVELSVHIYGLWRASTVLTCKHNVFFAMAASLFSILLSAFTLFLWMLFSSPHSASNLETKAKHLANSLGWFLCQRDRRALQASAEMMVEMLEKTGMNAAPSDILVGLILLRRAQQKNKKKPPKGHIDPSWLSEIKYYYQYAEATYGLPLFVYSNPTAGLRSTCCGRFLRRKRPLVEILSIRNVGHPCASCLCCLCVDHQEHDDLLYSSHENAPFTSPFFLCLDHEKKSLVLAIRGTLSGSDLVTDLHAVRAPFYYQNGASFTHSGMLHSARNILSCVSDRLREAMERYPDYRLVCVGHSLGAGIASLLTHLIRVSFHADAVCFAYSPPAYVATPDTVGYFESFCTSVVLGTDVIARLHHHGILHLRDELELLLSHCHKKKIQILTSMVVPQTSDEESLLRRAARMQEYDRTYPPGKIVWITREQGRFNAIQVPFNQLDEILISSKMLLDHFPDRLGKALLEAK